MTIAVVERGPATHTFRPLNARRVYRGGRTRLLVAHAGRCGGATHSMVSGEDIIGAGAWDEAECIRVSTDEGTRMLERALDRAAS